MNIHAAVALPMLLPLLATSPARAQNAAAERVALRVAPLTGRLHLDGVLDEPAWSAADSIGSLVEIEPREGARPSFRTVIRVIADAEALVIGVRADDPDPPRIVRFARQRDAALATEDHIRIVLDTYLDGRSGYVFAVNPNGARYDALVADQGESENASWDAVWEAATTVTAAGWTAELRIPVRSLLFRPGLTSWGFNLQRRIQRTQETHRWASPRRDYELTQTSRAGLLTGLPSFDLGVGLTVRPAAAAGAGRPAPDVGTTTTGDLSLDITQRIGANTLGALTVNTDFAETDVDTRRTNLTRFPLFFPEKRSFFLEGSDIFDFGLGLGEDARPFFSRRIGLLGGREVPLTAGLKISGRAHGTNFGALAVRTGALDTMATEQVMGAVRVRQNVLRESSVGAIATVGDPLGRGGSWLAGPDFTWQTSHFRGNRNLLVGVWGLAMDAESLSGRRHAFGAKIDYPNDLWDIAFTYKWIGEAFQPPLGFVPRTGVQRLNFNVVYSPRPSRPIAGLRVRQMFHELLNTLVTDLEGRWESYRVFTAPVNWRLESGERFEFNYVPTGERIAVPFPITDSVTVPPGTYRWTRYRLEAGLASRRRISGQVTWWFGGFYGGTLDELTLTASWRPSALVNLELSGQRNVGRLPQGRFTQQVVGTRVRLNASPDLQLNSFLQYDNESDSFGANVRFRWTFHPLGDLFIVYNHNLQQELVPGGPGPDRRHWVFASNELLVKTQYSFRY